MQTIEVFEIELQKVREDRAECVAKSRFEDAAKLRDREKQINEAIAELKNKNGDTENPIKSR